VSLEPRPAKLTSFAAFDHPGANCRYVSLSLAPAHRDCSWYAECDLGNLHPAPRSGPDYASVPVLKYG